MHPKTTHHETCPLCGDKNGAGMDCCCGHPQCPMHDAARASVIRCGTDTAAEETTGAPQ